MTPEEAMVVLTGIYVLATIFICLFNYGSAKASKDQLAEMRRQFDEENRPYITVELIYERRTFYGLRFSNHGKKVANHVRIELDQAFLDSVTEPSFKQALDKTKGKECIIGIGQHYDLFFGSNEFRKSNNKVALSGNVVYNDGKLTYTEPFSVDFDSYATIYSVNNDADDMLKELKAQTRELKGIKDALKELNTTLKTITQNTSDEKAK